MEEKILPMFLDVASIFSRDHSDERHKIRIWICEQGINGIH
jgi:hypothetical protein